MRLSFRLITQFDLSIYYQVSAIYSKLLIITHEDKRVLTFWVPVTKDEGAGGPNYTNWVCVSLSLRVDMAGLDCKLLPG